MAADSLETHHSLLARLACHGPEWNSAWNEFFVLYGGWIRSLGFRRSLREHEVDDVLQETMTELFRILPLGRYRRETGKFRGFLCGVVRQNILRALERRRREENRADSLQNPALASAQTSGGPDDEFEHSVRLALVEQALRALVTHQWATQRRVDMFVALTAQQKMPAEVAAEFGTNRNNVDAAKHAVKTKLQRMIRCLEEGIDPRDLKA